MENMLNEVVASFLAVMKGHADKSFAQIEKELSQLRSDFFLEINKLLDSMEKLILQSEKNHEQVIDCFAGLIVRLSGRNVNVIIKQH
jgi:hypothetical protein